MPNILPNFLSYTQVSQFMWSLNLALGLIPQGHLHLRPFQRHFGSLGLKNRFTPPRRSDTLVLADLLRQWQDLSFLPQESLSDLSRQISQFLLTPLPRLGHPYGEFPDIGYLDPFRPQAPHQQFGAQGGNLALRHWVSVLRGHQLMIAADNTTVVFLHEQTVQYPFPHPVTSSSLSVPMATNLGPSHSGQTLSGLPERDSGPSISTKSAHNNRVESPPRNSKPHFQDMGNSNNGHVCHSP